MDIYQFELYQIRKHGDTFHEIIQIRKHGDGLLVQNQRFEICKSEWPHWNLLGCINLKRLTFAHFLHTNV